MIDVLFSFLTFTFRMNQRLFCSFFSVLLFSFMMWFKFFYHINVLTVLFGLHHWFSDAFKMASLWFTNHINILKATCNGLFFYKRKEWAWLQDSERERMREKNKWQKSTSDISNYNPEVNNFKTVNVAMLLGMPLLLYMLWHNTVIINIDAVLQERFQL